MPDPHSERQRLDQFAAAALTGLLFRHTVVAGSDIPDLVDRAWEIARAMRDRRDEGEPPLG